MRQRQLARPVVVEAVVQVGKYFIGTGLQRSPVLAQEGGTLEVRVAAVGVVRQAQHTVTIDARGLPAQAQGHGSGVAQVAFDNAVQQRPLGLADIGEVATVLVGRHHAATQGAFRVQPATGVQIEAVVIPGARSGGHGQTRFSSRALAHQVHRAPGVTCPHQQARSTAQYLDTVEHRHVGDHPAGVGIGLPGHAVDHVTVVGDVEATGTEVVVAITTVGAGDTGGLGHHLVQ